MSKKFLMLNRNDYTLWLMSNHPWAYLLLNLIALRACRCLPNVDGLKLGEAFIGDWHSFGATRGQYRHALKILIKEKHIEIIETNRNRKKATTGTTTEGTKVKILNSIVWDVNFDDNNHRNDHLTTTEQPRRISNNNIKKEEEKNIAQPAKSPLRSTRDCLFFDFEKGQYMGITDIDLAQWKEIYPHIEIHSEIIKSINWLKSNPSKSKKSLWRKFLTGWLQRANDSVENKKAFRFASGGNAQDRRTKNKDGTPIASRAEELF